MYDAVDESVRVEMSIGVMETGTSLGSERMTAVPVEEEREGAARLRRTR